MTQAHGVVGSAGGLVPRAHAAWGYRDRAEFRMRAAEYAVDGQQHGQRVEYLDVTPTAGHFVFEPDHGVVDAEKSVAKLVEAAEAAIANGYTGYRAVVDVTPMARTPQQREAVARMEFLLDHHTAVRPFSALCGYDISQLGDGARELICLHPFVSNGEVTFRIYTNPNAGVELALAGEIDAASEAVFATALRRIWPSDAGRTVRIDAAALEFVGHQQLAELDRVALERDQTVLLLTDQPIPTRLAGLLDLRATRIVPLTQS
ncbi:MEDS domain-containing protein [Mycobacterium sp.]|uniref:MEDS domain-containing protein n=1 Tax=Mycobacterium sp. TaxID=1785 RepID=UPI002CFA0A24|nr:MEDS domain-containing protein [Mycobacterium sp.]HKP41668.1 MEDS domain-containing protein [Mycobacterium sp.]